MKLTPTVRPLKVACAVALMSAGLGAIGCSTSKSSSPSPTSPSTTSTSSSLSAAFTTNCAISGCHGSDGSSVPSGSSLAALKGNTTYGETNWTNTVRNGISGTAMVSFTTSTYSAANLEADYTVLTGLTWQ